MDYDAPFEVSDEGTTTIQYWAVDGVGNVEVAKNAFVRIDRTEPALDDDAPAGWSNTPQTVHIDASDEGCGVESVLYSTDGGTPDTAYDPETGVVVSSEGVTTLKYAATDLLGNESGVRSTQVKLDFTDPSSGQDAPTAWVQGPIDVHLNASDTLSGVSSVVYTLDGGAEQPYSGAFSVGGDGEHALTFAAIDNAGNRETATTVTIRSDETCPDHGRRRTRGMGGPPDRRHSRRS